MERDTKWTWLRRGCGILFLGYAIFYDRALNAGTVLLIAGLLGFLDVLRLQDVINMAAIRQERNGER